MSSCQHAVNLQFRPPAASSIVHKSECTQCFDTAEQGLDVCLTCFNGGCVRHGHSLRHAATHDHTFSLRLVKKPRQLPDRDQPPRKLTKVAVEADPTDADLYDYTHQLVCRHCGPVVGGVDEQQLLSIYSAIQLATSAATKSDVRQWQEEIVPCEHTLCLQQQQQVSAGDKLKLASHCGQCDQRENLWMCLTCGSVGCGRKQYDGSGGNNHGIDHFKSTGHQVSCKLGTITAEGAADVYCYVCEDMKEDPDIKSHLAVLGLHTADQQKTEKSMAELQLEQNLKFDFNMVSDDGRSMEPVFGPWLTGMKNIGNSCYMASVVQSLFSLPPLSASLSGSQHVETCKSRDPSTCFECQLFKMVNGLKSGDYSVPSTRPVVSPPLDNVDVTAAAPVRFQDGVAPRMFKDVVTHGHADFGTMQQQDAYEFLLWLLQKVTEKMPQLKPQPLDYFRFETSNRLECSGCHKVHYRREVSEGLEIPVPAIPVPQAERDATPDAPEYKPVSMSECLSAFGADESIEGFKCSACKQTAPATQRTRFSNFPPVLVMHMQRFVVENWVPKKLNVPVTLPTPDLDLQALQCAGPQPGEDILAAEEAPVMSTDPLEGVNEAAMEQLMAMGFSRNRAGRAMLENGGSAELAMEWLFTKMDDPSLDLPLPAATKRNAPVAIPAHQLQPLMDMGFTQAQARKALRQSDMNLERAVEWLFSNPSDAGEDDVVATAASLKSTNSSSAPPLTKDLKPNYVLHAVIAHKGTSTSCGHYVAYVRQPTMGNYALFNDEKVVQVPAESMFDAEKSAQGVGMGYLYIWLNRACL